MYVNNELHTIVHKYNQVQRKGKITAGKRSYTIVNNGILIEIATFRR